MGLDSYLDVDIVYYALCFAIFYNYVFENNKIYIYM